MLLVEGRFHMLEWALRKGLFAGVRCVNPELGSWSDFEQWLAGHRDDSDSYPAIDPQLRSEWDDLEEWLARPRGSGGVHDPSILRWHTVGHWG